MSFATANCIRSDATLSLYLLRNPSEKISTRTSFAGSENIEDWCKGVTAELLCGPVYVKSHIDITKQSLVVSFAHPNILLCDKTTVLLLCFECLFVSDYDEVLQEAIKSLVDKTPEADTSVPQRTRVYSSVQSHRLLRKQPQSAKPLPVIIESFVQVSVFPYKGPLDIVSRERILECVFFEDLIKRLVIAACGYSIEEKDMLKLSADHQTLVRLFHEKKEKRVAEDLEGMQNKALDILCWITCLAYCNGDK